jgi:predicted nucleotidyltransferase
MSKCDNHKFFLFLYRALTLLALASIIKTRREALFMDHKIMIELVDGILEIMEKQLIRIVLYGSVARGTNTEESDVDIALLLKGVLDKDTEDKLSDLVVDMNLKYDKVFSVIDIDIDNFQKWEKVTPFYKNVTQEGIVLWKAA